MFPRLYISAVSETRRGKMTEQRRNLNSFRRQSHRSIVGYRRLDVEVQQDDCQPTTIYITKEGKRAILFANSISVWDLDSESLMMVFEPDYKVSAISFAIPTHRHRLDHVPLWALGMIDRTIVAYLYSCPLEVFMNSVKCWANTKIIPFADSLRKA